MSTSSHLLKGLHFNISLEFDYNDSSRASLNVIKATLHRHRRQINNTLVVPSTKFFKRISNNLDIRYAYLQFDFDKATYLTLNGEPRSVPIAELVESRSKKKNTQEEIDFVHSLRFFPNCNADVIIDNRKIEFVINILKKLEFKYDKNEVLIISGEMIWSRFINSQELFNIIISSFKDPIYLLIDYYGIWQSLVNQDYKKLININKKYLLPRLLKLSVEPSTKSIEIQKDLPKKLLLINNTNLFNLTDGPYYYQDSLVPEWLLITKELKDKKENNFIRISQDLTKDFALSIGHCSQRESPMPQISVAFKAGSEQKCTKKVGEWVDVNEMIGSYSELEFSAYSFLNYNEVKVFDGQIVKKGDLIIIDRKGNKVVAPHQGKSDLKLSKFGILRLIRQSTDRVVKSPFKGYLEGFSNKEGYCIKTLDTTLIPFDFVKGVNVIGELSDLPVARSIYYCRNYSDFIKVHGEEGWTKGQYFKDQIRAVIINSVSFTDLDNIEKISNPNLNLGIIDVGVQSEINYLNNYIGKEVVLIDQGIIFNKLDAKFELKDSQITNINGKWAKGISLDGHLIYGKIISKSINNSNTVLISSDRGYSECYLSNIIII